MTDTAICAAAETRGARRRFPGRSASPRAGEAPGAPRGRTWSASEWTQVIDAIATLAWPAVIGGALYAFRRPLASLIGRGREVEVPGLEMRFDPPDPGPVEQVKRQLPREAEPEPEHFIATRRFVDTEVLPAVNGACPR
jgi:hypothetical protein